MVFTFDLNSLDNGFGGLDGVDRHLGYDHYCLDHGHNRHDRGLFGIDLGLGRT